mmetsp:Transcript_65530/g.152194  ORF Transcript_65530/g.152194 Transcript_65530/m.152194 type:complete len:341 (-) Transcript_65530:45-1067(-)
MPAAVLALLVLAALPSTVVAKRESQNEDFGLDVEIRAAPLLHFFIYRATSAAYPAKVSDAERSASFGNAAGVLHYIHREVIGREVVKSAQPPTCQRKSNIDRIVRYKVTMKSTEAALKREPSGFLGYAAMERGKCTEQDCAGTWKEYGFVPGCAKPSVESLRYNGAIWYSFPGRCPSISYDQQCAHEAEEQEPGGACRPRRVPEGTWNCTYMYEPAGELPLDDLVGITKSYGNYSKFCEAGGVESNGPSDNDTGVTIDFWKHYSDVESNQKRVAAVLAWFNVNYPGVAPLNDPSCEGPQPEAGTTSMQPNATNSYDHALGLQAWLSPALLIAGLLHRQAS